MTVEKARAIACSTLSDGRFYHTECVAKCARALAYRTGADPDQTEIAAFLHDIMKEQSDAVLLKTMQGSAIMQDNYLSEYRPLWHAFAGASYVRNELGVSQEIADAVFYHTSGHAAMTPMEKSVFLADYISEDRVFEGAAEVRKIAETDIDLAVAAALKNMIRHLAEQGKVIQPMSLEAYNYYIYRMKD